MRGRSKSFLKERDTKKNYPRRLVSGDEELARREADDRPNNPYSVDEDDPKKAFERAGRAAEVRAPVDAKLSPEPNTQTVGYMARGGTVDTSLRSREGLDGLAAGDSRKQTGLESLTTGTSSLSGLEALAMGGTGGSSGGGTSYGGLAALAIGASTGGGTSPPEDGEGRARSSSGGGLADLVTGIGDMDGFF